MIEIEIASGPSSSIRWIESGDRRDPVGCNCVDQFAEQERIAARSPMAGGAEGGFGVVAEPSANQFRAGRVAQLRRAHNVAYGLAPERGQQDRVDARLAVTRSGDHQHWQVLQATRHVDQPANRAGIGPVQVIDREQKRRALREVRRQPVQPVMDRGSRVAKRQGRLWGPLRDGLGAKRRGGQRSGTAEELATFRSGRGRQPCLEELANDSEPQAPFELAAPSREHLHARGHRSLPGGVHERRLADPRRALDQEQRPSRLDRGADPILYQRQLRLALEQSRAAACHLRMHPRQA